MDEAAKSRLKRRKDEQRAEETGPGRGTLAGMDPYAWMSVLDAFNEGHGDRADVLRELRVAGFVVPFEEHDLRNLTSDEKVRFWWDSAVTVYPAAHPDGGGRYSIEFSPRRFVLVPVNETPIDPADAPKYHDVTRIGIRYLPKDRETDLRRIMGDDVLFVPNPFKRRGLGVPVSPSSAKNEPAVLTLFPADKVAVFFRMLWFPTADNKAEMEKYNRPYAVWRHFARAVRKYLVAFSDEWVAQHECEEDGS